MRDPSIHIRESDLIQLFDEELGINDVHQVRSFMLRAKEYAINERTLLATTDRLEKAAKKILAASSGDTMLMAKIIFNVRREMRHKGVMMAKPGSREWSIIKDITNHAIEFCNDFNFTNLKEGFTNYIRTALTKMTKFGLTQIPSRHTTICEDYEAKQKLMMDDNPLLTERCYKTYNQLIIAQIGSLLMDYKDIPSEYTFFMQAAENCVLYNVKPEVYIQAQFDGLSWTNGAPGPNQLVSQKAIERLQKYLMQHKEDTSDKPTIDTSMVDKLNRLKNL